MSKYVGRIITDQAPAGYSVYFDGSGDYLSLTQSAFAVGTSNFTLEAWVYLTAAPGTEAGVISSFNTGGGQGFYLAVNSSRQPFFAVGNGAVSNPTVTGTAISLNTWVHLAGVRSSGTLTLYVNGTSVGTPTSATASIDRTLLGIGLAYPNSPQGYITGYISNARVTSSAVYTAAFTPPTQLLNVTNTSLLTCNSPAIVDQSSNAFAITVNGNAAVSTFTPFTAYVPYNPALGASTPGVWTLDEAMQAAATRQWNMYDPNFPNTTLLLHGNGTNGAQNNTFLDSSTNNFTITRNGNTTQGSFSPFSQTGWGNYFPGTSGVSAGSSATLAFGTGNFTIECWAFLPSVSANSLIASSRVINGTSNNYWSLYAISTNQIEFQSRSAGGTQYYARSNTNTFLPNTWNHIAVTRSSGLITVYVNGVAGTTTVNDGSVDLAEQYIGIGLFNFTTYESYLVGYVSNFRAVKGGVLYTGNFTPSTAPLTTTVSAGTVSLLTCQSNRFIDNSSNAFAITVNGTPSVQAFSPFYPTAAYTPATTGGSGYFDGTGDYLTSATNTALQLGSSDFSIEWWEYRTALNNVDTAIVCGDGTFNALLGYYNSGFPRFYLSTTGSSWNVFSDAATGAIAANSWNHFVLTRSGTAFRVFLNGVLSIYATGSGSVTQTTNQIFISGGINGSSVPIEGYMAGVRFVKGSIPTSYQTSSTTTNTSIFTPPTTPVTTTSQGATSGDVKYLVNFTNAGIVDSTAKNVLETIGNAQISTTQSKFGGSSMYFDGTGDYLVTPSSPNNILGSGDFTVELWVYPSNTSAGYRALVASENYDSVTGGWTIYQNGTSLEVWLTGSINLINATSALTANTWQHVALSRASGTVRLFVNGISVGSASNSASWTGQRIFVGDNNYTPTDFFYIGYIDDLRITRFARYTGNFTPQTSQWQDQ